MLELHCDSRIELSEDDYAILNELLPLESERTYSQNSSYSIKLIPIVKTLISLHSAKKILEEQKNTLEEQVKVYQTRLNTVQTCENLFVIKGYARQMLVLQVLAEINRPSSLNFISTQLLSNPKYISIYKSRSNTPVRGALQTLTDLGYVDRLERGIYMLSMKGRMFLDRNLKKVGSKGHPVES